MVETHCGMDEPAPGMPNARFNLWYREDAYAYQRERHKKGRYSLAKPTSLSQPLLIVSVYSNLSIMTCSDQRDLSNLLST
jgi:hypothetical protein